MTRDITPEAALQKIFGYCAYQERSHRQVKQKLYSYGLRSKAVDEIMVKLITDGFLNEERFSRAFAGGKFRIKKWGRNKIINELEKHGLTANCIRKGLSEIDTDEYIKTLQGLLEKKAEKVTLSNVYARKNHISIYAIRKGYEPDVVWRELNALFPGKP